MKQAKAEMNIVVKISTILVLALGAPIAGSVQDPEQMRTFTKAFCTAVGWEFDANKVQVRAARPSNGKRWWVMDPKVFLILNESPIYVRSASNSGLKDARRWTSPNPNAPLIAGSANWFSHGKTVIGKLFSGVSLTNLDFKEVLLQSGPTPMQASDANTARVHYRFTAPASRLGDEATLIFDRANGKLLTYSYLKKR